MEHASSSNESPQLRAHKAVYTEENIEALRAKRQAIKTDTSLTDDERTHYLEHATDEYLNDHGVNEEDDHYESSKESVNMFAAMDEMKWHYGDFDESSRTVSGKNGYDVLHDKQEELFGRRLDFADYGTNARTSAEEENELEDTPEHDPLHVLREQVGTARDAWARMSAKRAGKAWGKKKQEHEEFERAYLAKVHELGRQELADTIENEPDELKKNTAVVAFLFEEQQKLRDQVNGYLNGTHIGKFVERMNRGSKVARIGKAALLGAGLGFGGALVAGAIGTGVGAAVAIGASHFVRGYIAHDKRGLKKADEAMEQTVVAGHATNDRTGSEIDTSSENHFDTAQYYISTNYEASIKDQQKARRKALGMGAVSVALGAGAGYGLHALASNLSVNIGGPDLQLLHPFGSPDLPSISVDKPPINLPDAQDMQGGVGGSGSGDVNLLNWTDFAASSRTVIANEGWYNTFNQLGIPEEHWQHVLESAGPKLESQGWSYFDQGAQEWRISHKGELTRGALRTIARAAKRDGFDLAA